MLIADEEMPKSLIFTAPSHRQPGPDSVGVDGGGVDSIDGAADAAQNTPGGAPVRADGAPAGDTAAASPARAATDADGAAAERRT